MHRRKLIAAFAVIYAGVLHAAFTVLSGAVAYRSGESGQSYESFSEKHFVTLLWCYAIVLAFAALVRDPALRKLVAIFGHIPVAVLVVSKPAIMLGVFFIPTLVWLRLLLEKEPNQPPEPTR